MSRKKFIESYGATCENWQWSWSFVNHKKKYVIFGAWDTNKLGESTLIFSEDWEINKKTGRRNSGFGQSYTHIELINEKGYSLYTFPMRSSGNRNEGPKIRSFTRVLTKKSLLKSGNSWFATDLGIATKFPNEVDTDIEYDEGAVTTVSVNRYERSAKARDACIAHHGTKCKVCGFNFQDFYGDLGKGYIHVHHIAPLSEIGTKYKLNPIKDLVPVCANCHAMIHRGENLLSVPELRSLILSSLKS